MRAPGHEFRTSFGTLVLCSTHYIFQQFSLDPREQQVCQHRPTQAHTGMPTQEDREKPLPMPQGQVLKVALFVSQGEDTQKDI